MSKGKSVLVWVALLVAGIVLAILAYRSGYAVGSDLAERENAAEAR